MKLIDIINEGGTRFNFKFEAREYLICIDYDDEATVEFVDLEDGEMFHLRMDSNLLNSDVIVLPA